MGQVTRSGTTVHRLESIDGPYAVATGPGLTLEDIEDCAVRIHVPGRRDVAVTLALTSEQARALAEVLNPVVKDCLTTDEDGVQ